MSVETVNRFNFFRQDATAQTAANTTYPTATPTLKGRHIDRSANSSTNGVWIPERRASEKVVVRVTATGTTTSVNVAIYGYITTYNTAAADPVNTALQQWDHLFNLNGGTAITPTTNATGGVSVIQTAANNFRYNELVSVGGGYERLLAIPVAVAGADVNLVFDFGFYGEI